MTWTRQLFAIISIGLVAVGTLLLATVLLAVMTNPRVAIAWAALFCIGGATILIPALVIDSRQDTDADAT